MTRLSIRSRTATHSPAILSIMPGTRSAAITSLIAFNCIYNDLLVKRYRVIQNRGSSVLGSSHTAAEWLIYKSSSLLYDSGIDTTNLTSLIVPSGKLTSGNTYTWQVRYQD